MRRRPAGCSRGSGCACTSGPDAARSSSIWSGPSATRRGWRARSCAWPRRWRTCPRCATRWPRARSRLVLTAAHCVDGEIAAAGFAVYFGTDATVENDPGFRFLTFAESVAFHPDWDPADVVAGNDIGLLHLRDEVPIAPAALRTAPLRDAERGASVELAGWGITGGGAEASGVKRRVLSRLDDFDDTLVVVGNPETNTCSGDSGGPAFLALNGAPQVVGVTSFGAEPGTALPEPAPGDDPPPDGAGAPAGDDGADDATDGGAVDADPSDAEGGCSAAGGSDPAAPPIAALIAALAARFARRRRRSVV